MDYIAKQQILGGQIQHAVCRHLKMSALSEERTKRLIKICPGCAMAHLAKCSKLSEPVCSDVVPAKDKPHCRLSCLLTSCKQLCGVSSELTLMHLVLILFHVLVTASSAVMRMASALLPVCQYLLLILIYLVECFSWVWTEDQLYLKVIKGLVTLACLAVLFYTAHVLVLYFVQPTLSLLLTLLRRGYYLM